MSNAARNKLILLLAALAYWALFIPANLTGARDPNMLASFQIDEFAQYPSLLQMTTAAASVGETLHNFFFYDHYYYGYPFYVASTLAVLPAKLAVSAFGLGDSATQLQMLALRQLSPAFMAAAILVLVHAWTGFRSLTRSLLLFGFLACIPAVFLNNMWWHPDSLAVLFVALALFSFARDKLRFGRWFYVAAVMAGLATGTKVIGFYFAFTIPVYVFMAWRTGRLDLREGLRHGALFAMIAGLTVIASNPLLLVPGMQREILGRWAYQGYLNLQGWGVRLDAGPGLWYREVLRLHYAWWWVAALAVGVACWGVFRDRERRLLNVVVLSWAVPFGLFMLFTVANRGWHYFIPVGHPLLSAMGNPALWRLGTGRRRWLYTGAAVVAMAILGTQLGMYVKTDVDFYRDTLLREKESPALAFYEQVREEVLKALPERGGMTVFRDPYVYVADRPDLDVHMKFGQAHYEDIEELQPDLILLQQGYVATYSDPAIIGRSIDRENAVQAQRFYADARDGSIRGYRKLFETGFGVVFEREQ